MAGEPLNASFPASVAETAPRIQAPDGREHPARIRPLGDRAALSYADTAQSGIYVVRFDPPNGERTFAVNVDPLESDLARIEPEGLRAEVWPEVPFQHQVVWQDLDLATVGNFARSESGLHVVLLYCVLGLLLADILLGWKFGYA